MKKIDNAIDLILTDENQVRFRNWLELNIESITWEGRYTTEFDLFWNHLFAGDSLLSEQFAKLDYSMAIIQSGPIISWFQWMTEKFICYCFIYTNLSIREIALHSSRSESVIALILREFFVQRFPHLEDGLNDYFHMGTITSAQLDLTFKTLQKSLQLSDLLRGSLEDEIMTNLELTLYDDWNVLYEDVVKQGKEKQLNIEKIKHKASVDKQIKFIWELSILFLLGGLIILGLKFGNKWYEDYLIDKITLLEPNFFWLDKSLSFKEISPTEADGIELNYKELESLEALENRNVFSDDEKTTRFEVESDVILTSVDALPRDFTAAGLEQSEYEELRKGGYRDTRYGRQKAYRVMMTTAEAKLVVNQLSEMLEKYGVKKADNVRPGTQIPGGYYFNLYVPRKLLKGFLSSVSAVEDAQILESKTRFGGPFGMNKVFIWIKTI